MSVRPAMAHRGALLGQARAEADADMLDQAFVVTQEFTILTKSRDMNYVVGRRGAGKSALCARVAADLETHSDTFVIRERIDEASALSLRETLARLVTASDEATKYRQIRAICRRAWEAHILTSVAKQIEQVDGPLAAMAKLPTLHSGDAASRCEEIVELAVRGIGDPIPERIPKLVVEAFALERLREEVSGALRKARRFSYFLQDGLDEGWLPDAVSSGVLGGLSLAVADLVDKSACIHGLLFIRDNMFRALARFDGDSSRHLDNAALRLAWDSAKLFELIVARLKVVFGHVGSNKQIWGKSVEPGLQGFEGFRDCLRHTLFRPRDALVLFNDAFLRAQRDSGRTVLRIADVDAAAIDISSSRLADLLREYEEILPGMRLFVEAFKRAPAVQTIAGVLALIEGVRAGQPLLGAQALIIDSAQSVFSILQSVGFLGLRDSESGRYVFCHDGSEQELDFRLGDMRVAVHPCYWRALTIDGLGADELVDIHDEYKVDARSDTKDLRTRRIGEIVDQFRRLPVGAERQREFEKEASRAVAVLFEAAFRNVTLTEPKAPDAERHVLAQLRKTGLSGAWARAAKAFDVSLVAFVPLNVPRFEPEHVARAAAFQTPGCGKLRVVISQDDKKLSDATKDACGKLFRDAELLVVHLSWDAVLRCFEKQRRVRRIDYTERQISKLFEMTRQSAERRGSQEGVRHRD